MNEWWVNIGFVAVVIVVARILGYFTKRQKTFRKYASLSFKSIDECVESEINKIKGQIVNVKPQLTTPFTKRKCCVYKAVVNRVKNGKYGPVHTEVIVEEKVNDFLVEYQGEYALVRTKTAELIINRDFSDETSLFVEIEPELIKYVEDHGIATKGLIFNKNFHFSEKVLEIGEEVSVLGSGRWINLSEISDVNLSQLNGQSRIFVFENTEAVPLCISDEPVAFKEKASKVLVDT